MALVLMLLLPPSEWVRSLKSLLHAVWAKPCRNCNAYTWGSSVSAPQLKQRWEFVFVLFHCSRKQAHLNHRWLTTAYTLKDSGRKALAVVSEARLLHIATDYWIFLVFLGTGKKELGSQAIAAESQPPSSSTLFPTASYFGHVSRECSRPWTLTTIETVQSTLRCVCLNQRVYNKQKKQ